MDYENGNKESKLSKDKKYCDDDDDETVTTSSDEDDDDSDKNHKVKPKSKYKERKHKKDRRDKSHKDKERSKSRRDRHVERSYHEKSHKHRDYKDKDKRRRSKNKSRSPSSKRHRSRSRSKHRSRSRSRHRSRSRTRSRSQRRSRSSSRQKTRPRYSPPYKRKPYEDKRYESYASRSNKDVSDSLPFSHNKSQRKMAILEKLGIDLVVPGSMDKPQTGMTPAIQESLPRGAAISGELAAYCNLTPANSKQIMERLARKKVLWQNKSAEQKPVPENVEGAGNSTAASAKPTTVWQSAIFSKDGNSKQTAKFKRLMGIKEGEVNASSDNTQPSAAVSGDKDMIKKQEEMFQNMEMQYEVARASTHTHRGIGLGFGIHQYPR